MVLDLVVIGLAIAFDPIPLTAYLLVLPSKRGVVKGATFLLGWLASLAIVVAVTALVTGGQPPKPNTAPTLAALAVKIAVGAGLIAIAIRQRRKMSRPRKPKKPPKWQAGVDNMSPWFAMGLAPLVQPWGLIAAGTSTVLDANLSTVAGYLTLVLFCVLATSSYLAMEIYAAFSPDQSQVLLARVRTWIDTHTDQVIIVGCLVLGWWLVGQSVYLIVTSQ